MTTEFEAATGRYFTTSIAGDRYRIYFEEAGSGPALLLQHTAGSDGRQWRHLLEDSSITDFFRVIAYDLPQHGKSLPALGSDWWRTPFRLTTEFFLDAVVSIADALELGTDTVYMGCSMGGHLAGDIALHRPDRFRAVIGIEGGVSTRGSDDSVRHMDHPRVTNAFKASVMYGLTAPMSPEHDRREATWGYLLAAPATHRGDMVYYVGEHDLTETARLIDTGRIGVHLMSGEYDWSVTPENTRELARLIPGSTLTEMQGIGHFPMIENYPLFRSYLEPILAGLRSS